MPKPVFHPFCEVSSDARQDLYSLLCTSTVFFHAAAKALWTSLPSPEILMRVLYYELGGTNVTRRSIGPRKMELDRLLSELRTRHIGRLCDKHMGAVRRFLFYAQSVVHLRATSLETSGFFYEYFSARVRLAPTAIMFPHLQELSWLEHHPCLASGSIIHILRSAQVSTLTLKFPEQPYITRCASGRDFYTSSVIDTLLTISDAVPELRELTVQAPPTLPIPISAILRYEKLRRAHLHITLAVGPNSIFVPEFNSIEVGSLMAIELHWNPLTDLPAVYSILCAGELRELTVMVYGSPGNSFTDDLLYLAASTPPQLTRFEVYALGNASPIICAGCFADKVKPLLARRALQHIALVLTGYSLRVDPQDVDDMAHAWPDLRSLNLSFPLVPGSIFPDIRHVLTAMCMRCPRLRLLHMPALSTSGNTRFALPTFPGNVLGLLSSDTAHFGHPVLDIAFSLYQAFPHLEQAGSCDESAGWAEVAVLVEALRQEDHPTILEHVAHCMRVSAYVGFPYVVLILVGRVLILNP
ncbi:hypothetical protein C8Q77DRAFT_1067791 [Trametes polyzona]|nr:hypothetical protein C8Q77DRAFT_1067791 [Trametes polyzona]